jgi:hypothetical protein
LLPFGCAGGFRSECCCGTAPGAALYLAQMSLDPATDASWVTLYGNGKSRALPPLVAGQHYLFRVCALATTGQPSAWSTNVSFIGK